MQFLSSKIVIYALKRFNIHLFIIDYQLLIILFFALHKYIFIFIILYLLIYKPLFKY